MKYVIGVHVISGYYFPIVFPDEITHYHIGAVLAIHKCSVRSAGFLYKKKGKWKVVKGKASDSLKIGPKNGDTQILNDMLVDGLTSLEMANMKVFREIENKKGKK